MLFIFGCTKYFVNYSWLYRSLIPLIFLFFLSKISLFVPYVLVFFNFCLLSFKNFILVLYVFKSFMLAISFIFVNNVTISLTLKFWNNLFKVVIVMAKKLNYVFCKDQIWNPLPSSSSCLRSETQHGGKGTRSKTHFHHLLAWDLKPDLKWNTTTKEN